MKRKNVGSSETKKKMKKESKLISNISEKSLKKQNDEIINQQDILNAKERFAWCVNMYESANKGLSKIEMYINGNQMKGNDFIDDTDSIVQLVKKHNKYEPVLVITRSAIRACEILKQLSVLKRPVYKLFPKNAKLEAQLDQIKSQPALLSVGTPSRIIKLIEGGVLDNCIKNSNALIVFDLDMDAKSQSVFTLDDTRKLVIQLLREQWLPHDVNRAKLCFLKSHT